MLQVPENGRSGAGGVHINTTVLQRRVKGPSARPWASLPLSPQALPHSSVQRCHMGSLKSVLTVEAFILMSSGVSDSLDPTDWSPPGSSVHGILQASTLERAAMPASRAPSRPGHQTCVSCIGRWILSRCAPVAGKGYNSGFLPRES